MSLARRLGLTELDGYVPAAFVVSAFAAGVQAALIVQAFGDASYPPIGKGTLAWSTLAVLGLSAVLHVPPGPLSEGVDRVRDRLAELNRRRHVILEPYLARSGNGPVSSSEQTNGGSSAEPREALPTLEARVHSPITAAPVIAPGEPVPITIEAEPEVLAKDLTATVEVTGPQGSRTVERPMEGTEMTLEERFGTPGSFSITVRLTHPRSEAASKTLEGRVASYREEVGRLFEQLKERMMNAELDVGPQSTPREVCNELRRTDAAPPDELADLAVELEVSLYGDEEIDRSTYETVHQALQGLRLDRQEVTG